MRRGRLNVNGFSYVFGLSAVDFRNLHILHALIYDHRLNSMQNDQRFCTKNWRLNALPRFALMLWYSGH